MTLELSDLQEIRANTLRQFDERLAAAQPANAAEIEREAARLESQLEQLYSFTAAMARREPDVEKTAELWRHLVGICDEFARRVLELSSKIGSSAAYDNILDIRSAAEELRALHSA
jgi:hypothetical protein